jgi:hypothetical protein
MKVEVDHRVDRIGAAALPSAEQGKIGARCEIRHNR